MAKKSMDQTVAWIFAFVGAGAIFGILYLITNFVASHTDTRRRPHDSVEEQHEHDDNANDHSDSQKDKMSESEHPKKPKVGQWAVHWAYRGSEGPEHWGDLSPDFKLCSDGRKQSPIDIEKVKTASKLLPLKFVYHDTEVALHNNGHTIQGNYGSGSHVEISGDLFDLLQFHFHSPSEHREAGIQYDAEVHFVHKDHNGKLAVLGILIEEGKHNSALDKLWKDLPQHKGDRAESTVFNVQSILPKNRIYNHYMGSLTTPPCSENVRWYVLKTPIQMSSGQIDRLVKIVKFNARPAQGINKRVVLRSTR